MSKTNSEQPAPPFLPTRAWADYPGVMPEVYYGLTKREAFAMAAMQGLIARTSAKAPLIDVYQLATDSMACADELLKALEK